MSFDEFGLVPELVRAIAEKGYTEPTPIQSQAIPAVLSGRDVLAGAQTGTGKTAAFVLPILHSLSQGSSLAPRALVLTPTRELAAQIAENAHAYGKYIKLRTVVVYGGVGINPQMSALRHGCDLLVATPGRLLDLVEQRAVDLRSIKVVVLDEADRMLDMGFIHAIRRLLKLVPQQRQNLMFSATYSAEIRELASRILRDPVEVEVAARNATADRVEQVAYRVPRDQKRNLLVHLIKQNNWHQVLVFTRTKHGANRLAEQLDSSGVHSLAIHGNKSQAARTRALADFKDNKITALVATEVAARGLDIKELPHVVNYDMPAVPADYVHRIGRTARAGATGHAVSLVSPDDVPLLRDVERVLKQSIQIAALPEFEAAPTDLGRPRSQLPDRPPFQQRGNGAGRGERSGGRGNSGGGDRASGRGRRSPDNRGGDRAPAAARGNEAPRAADGGIDGNRQGGSRPAGGGGFGNGRGRSGGGQRSGGEPRRYGGGQRYGNAQPQFADAEHRTDQQRYAQALLHGETPPPPRSEQPIGDDNRGNVLQPHTGAPRQYNDRNGNSARRGDGQRSGAPRGGDSRRQGGEQRPGGNRSQFSGPRQGGQRSGGGYGQRDGNRSGERGGPRGPSRSGEGRTDFRQNAGNEQRATSESRANGESGTGTTARGDFARFN